MPIGRKSWAMVKPGMIGRPTSGGHRAKSRPPRIASGQFSTPPVVHSSKPKDRDRREEAVPTILSGQAPHCIRASQFVEPVGGDATGVTVVPRGMTQPNRRRQAVSLRQAERFFPSHPGAQPRSLNPWDLLDSRGPIDQQMRCCHRWRGDTQTWALACRRRN